MTSFFNNLTQAQRYLVIAIMAVVLYAVSATTSYSIFSVAGIKNDSSGSLISSIPGPTESVDEDPNAPKTEACPLDGSMHTKEAKDSWTARRPLAVMIENHLESRPQSGLSTANIVYEVVAEGGITRFMGVFLCNLSEVQVGPVRSAIVLDNFKTL